MIICFVDISGIVDNRCLDFLFIILFNRRTVIVVSNFSAVSWLHFDGMRSALY